MLGEYNLQDNYKELYFITVVSDILMGSDIILKCNLE
jgi:hypothetical protein